MSGFDGRLVVVTGAGSGIGRATALAFAEQGASVVATDINSDAAERTAELATLLGPKAQHRTVDVGDAGAMEQMATDVMQEHGVPDVVVNNAGLGLAGPMLDTTVEDWDGLLHVNLWGVIHGCRLFGRAMADRGEDINRERHGHIVNVASAAAFAPSRSVPAYSTTKAAVLMLSECLRAELADSGIGVSAICPGIIRTGITTATRFVGVSDEEQARRRQATDRLYKRRGLTADHVAAAILEAVRHNQAVVPVGIEASLMRTQFRFAPGLARRFARLDVTPR